MLANEVRESFDPSQDFLANWTYVSFTSSSNSTTETPPASETIDVISSVTPETISVLVELILASIGVLANFLVIFVVARYPEMRTVPNVFVLNLAVADLLYCCEFVPVWSTHRLLPNGWILGQTICTITRALYGICGNASILFVIAMSIERYQAVADPIGHHQRSSKKRTWLISAALWLMSVIFTIHIIAFSKVMTYGTYKQCGSDPSSIVPYEDYIKGILIYRFVAWCVLPLTILVPCYARLYYKLHHGDVIQPGSSSTTVKSRNRVTRMVTVVVAVFTVSWMPLHIVYLVKFGFHLYSVPEDHADPLELFVAMLSSTNSMINPFLYALLGDKFRIYMKKVLCCGRAVDKRRYQRSTFRSGNATRLTRRTLVWGNRQGTTSAQGKTAETKFSSSLDRNKATTKTAEKREYDPSPIELT
ncbi:SSTR2 [Branchiostoma lanceolatum]|uniref:SSTR2 protein n=1 Tax=Branchiostoma lanceolatum TaxID=7740 RepID=A0A8K0E4J7_BRALA|nr:SSTR2 [Branchiostoma lanceolatum]